MFTAQQYRAKANEYAALLETARSPAEVSECRHLQRSFATLAENLEWMTANVTRPFPLRLATCATTVFEGPFVSPRMSVASSKSGFDKGAFMTHKFSVGERVTLLGRMYLATPAGEYEIRQLMPASDRNADDPIYRIKSSDEPHERIAQESDLTHLASRRSDDAFRALPDLSDTLK